MSLQSIKLLSFILLSTLLFFGDTRPVEGQGFFDIRQSDVFKRGEPVYFSGDTFTYNVETGIMTGAGNVNIVQAENRLRGNRLVIDLRGNVAQIEGDVLVKRGEDTVEGTRGVYDLERQTGLFYDARGHSEPWYVAAEQVEREQSGEYNVTEGSLTTCSLPHPHYRLQAGSIQVIPDERVIARDLTLYAGSFPVFYFPYYSQGLGPSRPPLEFQAGSQTDLGLYAIVGYNLELSEEIQLKPHVAGYTKSGVGGGLDGRLNVFGGDGRGRFDSFYISDQNEDNTDPRGIDKDRGKADLYYRQELPHDATALVQVEYVSDRDFLKTFDFGDFSERELPETFLNLERTGQHNVASFIVRGRLVDYIEDVERLPGLRLNMLEQEFGGTGLFFSAENESVYLNVEPGGPHSARNFSAARLAYPLRFRNWLGVVPFVEGDATYYSDTPLEDDEYRLSGSAGVTGQSRFHRVYGSPFAEYTAFRHLVVPTINYRFRQTPDDEPEDLHQFDSVDRIDRENMVELELKNYLQAKRSDGGRTDVVDYTITGGFEFDDGDDTLAILENELMIRPLANWQFATRAVNDFREERRSDLVSAVLRYTKPGSFKASGGFLHEDTVLKPHETQLVYSLSKALGSSWRVGVEQRYDIASDELSYQEAWVWRDLHCWEVLLKVTDRREATSFMVLLNVKAFPLNTIERTVELDPIGEAAAWPTRW